MFRYKQSPLLRSKLLIIRAIFLFIMLAVVLISANATEAATVAKLDRMSLFPVDATAI